MEFNQHLSHPKGHLNDPKTEKIFSILNSETTKLSSSLLSDDFPLNREKKSKFGGKTSPKLGRGPLSNKKQIKSLEEKKGYMLSIAKRVQIGITKGIQKKKSSKEGNATCRAQFISLDRPLSSLNSSFNKTIGNKIENYYTPNKMNTTSGSTFMESSKVILVSLKCIIAYIGSWCTFCADRQANIFT